MKFKINNNSKDERLNIAFDEKEASEGVFIVTKNNPGSIKVYHLKLNPDGALSSIGEGANQLTFKLNDQGEIQVNHEEA